MYAFMVLKSKSTMDTTTIVVKLICKLKTLGKIEKNI